MLCTAVYCCTAVYTAPLEYICGGIIQKRAARHGTETSNPVASLTYSTAAEAFDLSCAGSGHCMRMTPPTAACGLFCPPTLNSVSIFFSWKLAALRLFCILDSGLGTLYSRSSSIIMSQFLTRCRTYSVTCKYIIYEIRRSSQSTCNRPDYGVRC